MASVLALPITTQLSKVVVKYGTSKCNLDFQDTDQLIIDFSSMHMNKVYAVQNVVNAKIRLQKGKD